MFSEVNRRRLKVTFSLQALAMGMMTEYYHYIFTTLVSVLLDSKATCAFYFLWRH